MTDLFSRRSGIGLLLFALISTSSALAQLVPTETSAERRLMALNPQLQPTFTELTDGVFVAAGYGVSTLGFIVGNDGIVAVDAGAAVPATRMALVELRRVSDLPIVTVILTHGHADHIGGLAAYFDDSSSPTVWAHENFMSEADAFADAGITINRNRGLRQAGFRLPMEQRINNGIAPAMRPRSGAPELNREVIRPDQYLQSARAAIEVAGLQLELVKAPGETDDQLYVWYPDRRVLFAGDNVYKSWPNLYAIRGTPYRDIRGWIESLNSMIAEDPHYLVPGHTLSIVGRDQVHNVLIAYRDGIEHVFSKTVEGINRGMTPDELVDFVQLPAHLADHPYLQPYYGHPNWAVRSIFGGYLGWFDGNATNLDRLSARERAERILALAGGHEELLVVAQRALVGGDAQWAAELSDHLLTLDESDVGAMRVKADALEVLGRNSVNALARNYYLTVAQELRQASGE